MRTNTEKFNPWLVYFGLSALHAMPEIIAAESFKKPKRVGRSKEFTSTEKRILKDRIKQAIESGIIHHVDIWAHFEVIEENSEELIFLRSKSDGKLMSIKTFRDYVNRVKQEIHYRPISKKEIVLRLFKAGKSDNQISKESGISLGYINRILVIAGHRKSSAKWWKEFQINNPGIAC